jgi:hypothetical protein
MLTKVRSFLSLGLFVSLAACSAQKDGDYEGEPQATLRGTAVLAEGAQPSDAVLLMGWNNFAKNGDTVDYQTASIQGSFPAKFRLALTVLPPPESFNDFSAGGKYPNETPVAVAPIGAVRPGTNLAKPADDDVLGAVEDYVVVYVDREVLPNTFAATFLHGTMGKGFHLMKVVKLSDEQESARRSERDSCMAPYRGGDIRAGQIACGTDPIFDELHEVPFETEVTLKMAPEKALDWPNYT